MKLEPFEIWSEYDRITQYLYEHHIYDIVKINENFYDGRQWEGLDAKNMPKPVFNVLQRAGKYMIAAIGSNDIAINIIPFSEIPEDVDRMRVVSAEIEHAIEQARIKEASKLVIRNGYVDGCGYMLQSFDPYFETMQPYKGIVKNEIIDCTNVYFGNPYSNDIQGQPYIIIALRQNVHQVRMEAEELGLSEEDISSIQADSTSNFANDDSDDLVTVLLKFYKKKHKETFTETETDLMGNIIEVKHEKVTESVWFTKVTKNVTLIEPTDLGYRRYPISRFGWEPMKNSYLYTSPMTAVIPNQIFINKCFAIAQMYGLQSAFPKIVYDKTKVDIEEFTNSQTLVAPNIDMMGKVLEFMKMPDFSGQIVGLIDKVFEYTKDCLGVTDAALGNVRPDNTSAIIALQESSSIPLEIQKQEFYEFWEDTVRNIIDIISNSYGVRQIMTDGGIATVDFSMLRDINYNLTVDIGNGAQYTEIAQMNTLDKLVQAGYISPDVYIEAVPSKYIPQKAKVLESCRKQMEMQQAQQPMESRGSNPTDEVVPL